MGVISNFFSKIVGGAGLPGIKTAVVPNSAGVVFTVARALGSGSTLSLISGTNSNLTLNASLGTISATAAIGAGVEQRAVVREVNNLVAIEYPVLVTGYGTITPTFVTEATGTSTDYFPWKTSVAMASLQGDPDTLPGELEGSVILTKDSHWDYYAAKGFDHSRIEATWERLQPTLGGALGEQLLGNTYNNPYVNDATYGDLRNPVNLMKRYIGKANERGQKVVLDLCHNYGQRWIGYSGGSWAGKTKVAMGGTEVTAAHFADYCAKIVTAFGSLPGVVAIELMNEPQSMNGGEAKWRQFAQAAIDAIRAINTTIVIIVDGYNYANSDFYTYSPTLHTLTDSANRLIFSAHQYLDVDNSGRYAGGEATAPVSGQEAYGVNRLTLFKNWCTEKGVRGRLGETGVPNTDAWDTPGSNVLALAGTSGFSIALHQDFAPDNDPNIMQTFPNGGPDKRFVTATIEAQNGAWPSVGQTSVIVYDGGYSNGHSQAIAIPAGSNRLLVVAIYQRDLDLITSVTYGGAAMTRQVVSNSNGIAGVAIYTLIAPPVGTANLAIAMSDYRQISVVAQTFINVHQTTPIQGTSVGGDYGTTITTPAPDASVAFVVNAFNSENGSTTTAGANQKVLINRDHPDGSAGQYGMSTKTVANSASTWTLAAAQTWRSASIGIQVAA